MLENNFEKLVQQEMQGFKIKPSEERVGRPVWYNAGRS